jgi:hypothetical protein
MFFFVVSERRDSAESNHPSAARHLILRRASRGEFGFHEAFCWLLILVDSKVEERLAVFIRRRQDHKLMKSRRLGHAGIGVSERN